MRQEFVAHKRDARGQAVLNSAHSPEGKVKKAGATVAPPRYTQTNWQGVNLGNTF